jgi:putative heme-binding domain-containing protein
MTLNAIEKKEILPQEIDAIRRQRLLQHKDTQVRELAAKIFDAASNPDRRRVVDLYALQLPDKTDTARGAKLFAKACATCHKLDGKGQNVGPDLASVGDKSVSGLLTAILDPNRAVEARYINYAASTKAGKTYNGIISSETSTSITLVGPDGKSQQLLRNELDELASTGKSLMPDGLEKDLSPQDIADIIAFVRSNQNAPKRKQFPGNDPKTLSPDMHGIFRLLAASAAVYGRMALA